MFGGKFEQQELSDKPRFQRFISGLQKPLKSNLQRQSPGLGKVSLLKHQLAFPHRACVNLIVNAFPVL